MSESWSWDESLFEGSAEYYERGRLPYAAGLQEAVRSALGLEGTERLIDVGCGPGVVTVLLAPYVREAVGIDPDAAMISRARVRAHGLGLDPAGIRFLKLRAEELPAGLGTFEVATFAQSFHWMERERVAATVYSMLAPGGFWVHIGDVRNGLPEPAGPAALPAPPIDELRVLVMRWLGPVRRAGQGSLPSGTPSGEGEILAAAGFEGPERVRVEGGSVLERTTEDVIAGVYSRSDSAPHLFGDRLAEFDAEMRAILAEASPNGRFAQVQPDSELVIWRRPQ